MDIFDNSILSIVTKWSDFTRQRVIDNLKSRSVVAQLPLISAVNYKISQENGLLFITFSFERKPSVVVASREGSQNFLVGQRNNVLQSLSVIDTLTGRAKPFLGRDRGTANLGFLRRANVYENVRNKYYDELIEKIVEELPQIANKVIVNGI